MVAPGIITNGLGGNASNMILGQFHLGFLTVEIIVPPSAPAVGGGTAPTAAPQKHLVVIKVRHNDKTWEKQYMVSPKSANVILKVGKAINTIITDIRLRILNFRQKIKIKVRKK